MRRGNGGRYEAASNHVYSEFPVWTLCPYDTRSTSSEMLADVARTHSHVVTADDRHLTNPQFEDPTQLLTRRPDFGADPLEAGAPTVDLVGPAPAGARRAARDGAGTSRLDDTELSDFVYAVSEAVTNAWSHGFGPVRLRIWPGRDRVVATVTDRGQGPSDPFAGCSR